VSAFSNRAERPTRLYRIWNNSETNAVSNQWPRWAERLWVFVFEHFRSLSSVAWSEDVKLLAGNPGGFKGGVIRDKRFISSDYTRQDNTVCRFVVWAALRTCMSHQPPRDTFRVVRADKPLRIDVRWRSWQLRGATQSKCGPDGGWESLTCPITNTMSYHLSIPIGGLCFHTRLDFAGLASRCELSARPDTLGVDQTFPLWKSGAWVAPGARIFQEIFDARLPLCRRPTYADSS